MNLGRIASLASVGRLDLRDWFWLVVRVAAPMALGLLGTLFWSPSAQSGYLIIVAVLLVVCILLYVAVFSAGKQGERRGLWKWQVASLLVVVLGAIVAYGADRVAEPFWRVVGVVLGAVGGCSSLALMSVADWRLQGPRSGRRALATLPWFVALELGPLAAWLLVYAPRIDVVDGAHQSLLAAAMLVIIVEMLVFHRWTLQNDATVRAPRNTLKRIATVSNVRSWMGRIIPASLLVLTITNEGTVFAYVAWLLMFAAHGLRYLILAPLLFPQRRQDA